MIKDKFAHKSPEWHEMRKKVTDILYTKKFIGAIATEIMWVLEDAIKRESIKNTMKPRIK
jgi:hypothetical protein